VSTSIKCCQRRIKRYSNEKRICSDNKIIASRTLADYICKASMPHPSASDREGEGEGEKERERERQQCNGKM
jgi:hypothetical protein